jgi:hypothetical protein
VCVGTNNWLQLDFTCKVVSVSSASMIHSERSHSVCGYVERAIRDREPRGCNHSEVDRVGVRDLVEKLERPENVQLRHRKVHEHAIVDRRDRKRRR